MAHRATYLVALVSATACAVFGTGGSTGMHGTSRRGMHYTDFGTTDVHYSDFWTADYGEVSIPYKARPARLPGAVYRVDTIKGQCRCLPSDSCWPSQEDWDQLNTTLHGQLIIPRPTGYPCYAGPGFDAATCQQIRQLYTHPEFVVKNAGSMQAPSFEDLGPMRCSVAASDDLNAVCQMGRVPAYGVAVTSVSDVQKAIIFARQRNLRVTVKSTGHDYLGRSTAPGSLLVWMQKWGSINTQTSFTPTGCLPGQAWNGPVVTVVGGKPAWSDVYQQVEDDFNSAYILGGGHCNSPGAAGGYPLGGGHSVLSPSFGLAVDNILEHKIVTADGRLLTANACQNKDLFWALRGGGGGTFGVLVSVTYKLHKVNAGYMAFNAMVTNSDRTGNLNPQQVEDFLEVMARRAGDLDATGWGGYFYFQPAFGFSMTFLVPADRPNAQTAMEGIRRELVDMQSRSGIILARFPDMDYFTHYDHFVDWRKTLDTSVVTGLYNAGGRLVLGSRLIPQAAFANPRSVAQTHMAAIIRNGFKLGFLGHLVTGNGVRNNPQASETSVTPAWREAVWHSILYTAWSFNSTDDQIAAAKAALNAGAQVWRDAYPDSGAYFNEAFTDEPNWQHAFWGANYERLLKIKKEVDPDGFFVCPQCAGSELRDRSGNCAKTPSYM